MNQSITITVTEAAQILRSYGMHCSTKTISDGIQDGSFPFGRVISVGDTGRRHIRIFRAEFNNWLKTLIPEEVEYGNQN